MTSYRFFFKMAAGSHIGFDLDNIRQPAKCNCWSHVSPQISSWSDLQFRRYCNFYILPFWLEIAYSRPFLGSFGGIFSSDDVTHHPNPQKAFPYAETRRLSHKAWKSVQRFDLGASREKKQDGTGQDSQKKKSESGNISPIWGETPTVPIGTKICMVGSLPDVITYAKFQVRIF